MECDVFKILEQNIYRVFSDNCVEYFLASPGINAAIKRIKRIHFFYH